MSAPRYSIVIPTYRRGDSARRVPRERLRARLSEGRDRGRHHRQRRRARTRARPREPFRIACAIRYLVNAEEPRLRLLGQPRHRREHGRSHPAAERRRAADARICWRSATACSTSDPAIGCVGCRAIEEGYENWGTDVGRVADDGVVLGNFDVDCGAPIEVEHVYGFCYVFTREAVRRAGLNDRTLLAQPYSSGNRIETDHCLSIRARGPEGRLQPADGRRASRQAAAGHERGVAAVAPERDPQHAVSVPEALRACSASAARRCG